MYLVTLPSADIRGFTGRECPPWCDDLLSFHGIKVASVRYMRSANIRYGSVRCHMLLFAPQGQTTYVCPTSPLLLSTSSLTLPRPIDKPQ